jgi:hypothetical protein
MQTPLIDVTIPLIIFFALALVGAKIKAKGQFILPPNPYWPDAEDPGLAMELASSAADVNRLLGTSDTKAGKANRHTVIAIQKIDRFFIPLYVLLFVSVALRPPALGWRVGVIAAAFLAGIFDYLEDRQIVGLAQERPGSSALRSGEMVFLLSNERPCLCFASTSKADALWQEHGHLDYRVSPAGHKRTRHSRLAKGCFRKHTVGG